MAFHMFPVRVNLTCIGKLFLARRSTPLKKASAPTKEYETNSERLG